MFTSWFKQPEIGHSRSSTLNPLQWALVILVGSVGFAAATHVPSWIVSALGVAAVINFALFIYAYIYFMVKSPDALRSESYSLRKMAIQKGLMGDSLHGLFQDVPEKNATLRLQQGESDSKEQEQ